MSSQGLITVRRFIVPAHVLDPTLEALRLVGSEGYEAFVVWGGLLEDDGMTIRFEAPYKPRQESHVTKDGLYVHVDEDALLEMNKIFNKKGLILAGQAHSHPSTAYHSDLDDQLPLVTLLGGLSLVIPDFAIGGRSDLPRFAWYRLAGYARWLEVGEETQIVIE